MRVSIREDDQGYANWRAFQPVRALLDGKILKQAFTADSDLGEAFAWKTDANGNIVIEGVGDDSRPVEIVLRGTITFELIRNPN